MHELAAAAITALKDEGATLATAESLTGGLLAGRVTGVPGASAVYVGGVVSYATAVKQRLLGVPDEVVAEYGVVSAECATAMAEGARALLGSTYAVSTTGVAGPDRQEDKPVGTVYVAVAGPSGTTVEALTLAGQRAAIRDSTCAAALATLVAALSTDQAGTAREETPLG
ncbi:CinA family protein [Nocardioides speluncae]|uniref:CinA family protein n=1 Tax=Nocardioides speluncae TaxID=2670337 RepID=UPI001475C78A|nr:CinA family protein [Nocardioides speluncae]